MCAYAFHLQLPHRNPKKVSRQSENKFVAQNMIVLNDNRSNNIAGHILRATALIGEKATGIITSEKNYHLAVNCLECLIIVTGMWLFVCTTQTAADGQPSLVPAVSHSSGLQFSFSDGGSLPLHEVCDITSQENVCEFHY